MELSLSGFLFEDGYSSQSLDLAAFCALARSAGYEGVELRRTQVSPDTPPAGRRLILTAVRDQGLRITCLTARGMPDGGAQRDEYLRRYLGLCCDLSCPLLKVGGEPGWMRGAVETAAQAGVRLAANNHVGGRLETVAGTLAYLEEVAGRRFGLLYDCLHLRLAGEQYLEAIPALAHATCNLLVHSVRPVAPGEPADLERHGRAWVKALPDHPQAQDWRGVFARFRSLGYDGPVTVIESGWPEPQREMVAGHCAAVLRRLWDEVGVSEGS